MSSKKTTQTIMLKDGEIEISKADAKLLYYSKLVREMSEDTDQTYEKFEPDVEDSIPLPTCSKTTFEFILMYLRLYKNNSVPFPDTIEPRHELAITGSLGSGWNSNYKVYADFINAVVTERDVEIDKKLVKRANLTEFSALILASAYMEVTSLFELCCAKLASFLINRTPEQFMEYLGETEVTPEEEEAARQSLEPIIMKDPALMFGTAATA